jgi:hypothetical protein
MMVDTPSPRLPMRALVPILAAAAVAASQGAGAQARIEAVPLVTPFSAGKPGSPAPPPWEPFRIAAGKKPTQYELVDDGGAVVLHAKADAAASALRHETKFDLRAAPGVEWRWKISKPIDEQDNAIAAKEDSPVRVILEFDGDRAKLSFRDRTSLGLADRLTGREVPYATMMYVWAPKVPVGTVIVNPNTGRVKMVVATTGAAVGSWHSVRRNALEDFRKAFGEEPGRLLAVGILTDTDNTGDSVEGWYGDVRFVAP